MPTLYNVSTKKPEELDGQALEAGLAAGTHAYPVGSRVDVYTPTGEKANLPAEQLREAISVGYRPVSKTDYAVDQYIEENKGIKGALKVGLGQFVDEAALGLPEIIYDRTQDGLEVAKKEALKKEFPMANLLGGVGGFGVSLFTGPGAATMRLGAKANEKVAGYLAEKIIASSTQEISKRSALQAARGILGNVAAKGVGGAVEGGVLSAPHAITEAVLGDPSDAAESLLMGVGLGAAFGTGGVLAKELFGSVKTKVMNSEAAKAAVDGAEGMKAFFGKKAEAKAVEALNPTLSQMERLENSKDVQKLGRFLIDEGIVTPLASKKDMFERLESKTSEIGRAQGDLLQKVDDLITKEGRLDLLVDGAQVAKTVREKVKQEFGDKDAYVGALQSFYKTLDGIEERAGTWTVKEANAQKSAWGDVIKTWGMDKSAEKKLAENIYRGINEEVERKVAQGLGDDALKQFKELKQKYGYLEEAEQVAKKSAAREAKNNDFGLTSYVIGGAGAVAGGAPGAVLALGGREITRRYGDQILAATYDKMAGLLFAEKAMKQAADKFDIIPKALRELGNKAPKARTASLDALLRMVDGEQGGSSPLSVEERSRKLEQFSEKAVKWAVNPGAQNSGLENLISPLSQGGAPLIAAALGNKYNEAINYVFSEAPKPPRPNSPFAPKYQWKPSDQELAAYEQKLQTVMDPFSVFDELKAGTLTKNHMDALRKVYPKMHQRMTERVQKEMTKGVAPISYQKRIKLSLLMDTPLDVSMTPTNVLNYQKTFLSPEKQVDMSNAKELNVAGEMASDVQKLMG